MQMRRLFPECAFAPPNTIVFVIDNNNVVCEAYGDILADYELTDTIFGITLLSLFNEAIVSQIEEILSKTISVTTISWKKNRFDVYAKVTNDPLYHFLYLVDVTRFIGVETKLQESQNDLLSKKEELQAVFDLAANGISILDHNGMFLYANRFFQKMMGYTMEELKYHSCISLSSSEYADASKLAVEHAIKNGSIQNFRKVCVTKSGENLNASMSLSYLKSRNEILMITSDITQDVRYQEELKRQVETEVAKRTEQYEVMCHQSRLAAMGEMIDSIAHQWRQPLNTLGIIVQGMRHITSKQGLKQEFLKEIETEMMDKLSYMSQTIDDFSTFFRPSKQKEEFNVLSAIDDAVRLIYLQLKSSAIEIQIYFENKMDISVFGLPNEFRQVILNIVHNAMTAIMRSNRQDGAIHIRLKKDHRNIIVSIEDNGGGIDESNMERIFDPYFSTRENGSGIGLYMSKIIIEHHMKGRLTVTNQKHGAEFTILLQSKE
ncbi:ATP-binding protein [uncultured Sulfuricurvum sp.]|uniref:PAS domain-containing sensor histidine kinase n=1 Tax=uncultured Sulfuricurvum sp. TaxID=430693 RepID=UPI002608C115|nr:ATP-binding protein [uncultured Sulfuricurvum sp.]